MAGAEAGAAHGERIEAWPKVFHASGTISEPIGAQNRIEMCENRTFHGTVRWYHRRVAKKKNKSDVAGLVGKYQKARQAGKRGYERADRIIRELAAAITPGEEIKLNESGRKAILHDRFAESGEKGAIWTPCAARRWDLEIIEP